MLKYVWNDCAGLKMLLSIMIASGGWMEELRNILWKKLNHIWVSSCNNRFLCLLMGHVMNWLVYDQIHLHVCGGREWIIPYKVKQMNRNVWCRKGIFASKIKRPWNTTAAECLWLRRLRNEDMSTLVQRLHTAAEGSNVCRYCRSIANSTYSSFCGGDARKHCETYPWTSEAIVFEKVTRFARSPLHA